MQLRIAAVAACALLLWTPLAAAFPMYWYDSITYLDELLPGSDLCDGHPTVAVMPETSPHGSPTPDSSIGFTFYDTVSKNVTYGLCPGSNYTLKVSFPDGPRLALLTADTASQVAFILPTPTAGCPNRVDLGRSMGSRASISFNATFTVPCSTAGLDAGCNGKTVLFKVTSASRVSYNWKQNSVSTQVTVWGACAAAAAASFTTTAAIVTLPAACKAATATPQANGAPTADVPTDHGDDGATDAIAATQSPGTSAGCFSLHSQHPGLPVHGKTGYVAIAFAQTFSSMYPADIVLGWYSNGRNGSPYIDTFAPSVRFVLCPDTYLSYIMVPTAQN
ncbi:hypothetical protein VOLCADRAFT_107278 [Volvox carteri f. nagariensis]|uniref:Pherophorin domain-containing protein n=1 Tax=Volvox carteri f. nagariensis TaxID=3068 RepID=D8UCY1_VOLCA|nr:uncharacterized protein VOLCADRAFT_107278 [Volvox carteri f. nagariensis]EFJ42421.1 hypothetical protein VOLCADRAFT_107278 [Volvox carteri f. nagariensis]|eukprot:XP_002956484.1 hypothetical protein VOLCADRAFT_107278 [Volvox carteri f. nagariensis]